jgi:hypothetical protein
MGKNHFMLGLCTCVYNIKKNWAQIKIEKLIGLNVVQLFGLSNV